MGRLAEMQRKLLEQMMGPEAMGVTNQNLVWSDDKVCRNFLCGTCPHALFTNTKMDLGPCPKSHTERLKNEFIAEREKDPNNPIFARFQQEYESNLFAFVDECDRRIRAAHRRLEKTPEENAKTTNLMREIAEIELAIQGGTEKIEQLGEQGKVDESMKEMAAIEALKGEKSDKERELQQLTETSGASGHQKLRVCDVCGAYLSVLDSDRRLADHFGGKMHLGYHELRNMLQQFRAEREARKNAPPPHSGVSIVSMPPPGAASGPRPSDRDRDRGGDYRSSRDREPGRDRGYDRERDGRRRDRERSRSPTRRRY
ncbi:small nuclear ribonucleoprotein [Hysterangium stoloniferum]|nr:small nuclear ribonucleoprotein [Hysterangium stoloniferum]